MRSYFVEIESTKIEIQESAGAGSPVFFCHSNSSAASVFRPILEGELGQRHRLIAMSFPGHGGSAAADPESTYVIPRLGELAAGVIRKLGLQSYILVGHSLGGHALLEASHLLQDALGLMLISAPPLSLESIGEAFRPDPSNGMLFAGLLNEADAMALAQCFVADNESKVAAGIAEAILGTDPAFRPSLLKSLQEGKMIDEWQALAGLSCRIALLLGTHDQFLQADYFNKIQTERLWRGQLIRFKNCGHSLQVEAPLLFSHVLSRFIADTVDQPRETCGANMEAP